MISDVADHVLADPISGPENIAELERLKDSIPCPRRLQSNYTPLKDLLPLRSEIVTLRTSWDEFRLDLEVEYAGPPIEIADSMPALEEMGTQAGSAHLAGYLIRQYADRVRIREKNGLCRVQLHFDH